MKRLLLPVLVAVVLLAGASRARAGLMLTLSAEGSPDLQNLHVNQTVTFDVSLSGLNPDEALYYLPATVQFDRALLGPATNITAGAIIPDLTRFQGTELRPTPEVPQERADGYYDAVFLSAGPPITSNGVFYSFTVTVQATGSGSLSFDDTNLTANIGPDPVIDTVLLGAEPLLYNVVPSVTAVPAPGALVLLLSGTAPWSLAAGWRVLRCWGPRRRD